MAVLLMVNTSGLTMDMHFCQGDLKRVNLLGKAKSCAEVTACMKKCGKELPACHKDKASDGDHDDCCANDQVAFDMDFDSGLAYIADFETNNYVAPLAASEVFKNLNSQKLGHHLATLPIPPLIRRNTFAILQTYRL